MDMSGTQQNGGHCLDGAVVVVVVVVALLKPVLEFIVG